METQNIDSSIVLLKTYLREGNQPKERLLKAKVKLATQISRKNKPDSALLLIKECRQLANNIVDRQHINVALGSIYKNEGNLDQALISYEGVTDSIDVKSNPDLYLKAQINAAETYRAIGDKERSLKKVEDYFETINQYEISDSMLLLGAYNRAAGIHNQFT